VLARVAHLQDDHITCGETTLFIGRNHVITVRHGSGRGHGGLRAHLEAAPKLLAHSLDYGLHAVLDFMVDSCLPIGKAVDKDVLAMEQHAIDTFLDREQVTRLFHLRRQLIRFQRVLGPMGEVCSKLVRLDLACIDADARSYLSDVFDRVRRVHAMVDALGEVLTSVCEVSSLLEQKRQGIITRQLAAWAAILAVPTAIAGIYGMNFENMPELKRNTATSSYWV
jgi:magnesium transporter